MTEDERLDLGWRIGWVYFIQSGQSGAIKIGWAKDPVKRMATLQTGSGTKLRLLGVVPGCRKAEREAHTRFSHGRKSGEWFDRSAILSDVMSLLLDRGFTAFPARNSRTITGQKAKPEYKLRIPSA